MILKLSPQNAEALFNLFTTAVIAREADTMDDQLVMLHMVAIYKKLRSKYEGLPRKSYNISVTLPEAIAYYIFWSRIPVNIGEYEWSIIIQHCFHIDAELANITIHQKQATKFLNQ